MPDYYQILRTALTEVPDSSPQTRNEIYNRAHMALHAKLKEIDPPVAEADLMREAQLFREAVARLETEFGNRAQMVAGGQTQPQKPQLSLVPTGPSAGQSGSGSSGSGATAPGAAAGASTAPQAPPAPQPVPKPRKVTAGDEEFLPAALEILETPPSPVRIALIVSICAFVVLGLAWSYFGHFDIVATAQGKLQPTGRVNVVQPLETGKVIYPYEKAIK